ncbi:hypothetical protein CRENBAI_010901 [Crenichthys baileyi]|uniref:Uncharacterized protein n=1 Tax=Crenichthys baileyi TaxID=28760 RepID=A0AAV9R4U3_9TELE
MSSQQGNIVIMFVRQSIDPKYALFLAPQVVDKHGFSPSVSSVGQPNSRYKRPERLLSAVPWEQWLTGQSKDNDGVHCLALLASPLLSRHTLELPPMAEVTMLLIASALY